MRLLVGDEANFQVLASLPNVEVRLSDSKTGFLIIDDVSTVSGPGTEFAEENNAHVYIDTPGTPEAVEELHRVIEAFDNAFDLSTALTASELTKPNTH